MSTRDFLLEQLRREFKEYFGVVDEAYLAGVADAWMDDAGNSKHRFDKLERLLRRPKRILDMATGCGTGVFYGLLNGYDMYGIDPEDWKFQFNQMKADEYGYDPAWKERLLKGVGEALPFPDNHFDAVTSYQTLEHVQDPYQVLKEMVRVTRPEGGIHLQCPDYRGTYEGHYRLPWLPLMPRPLAKRYLSLLKRPSKGIDTLQYITMPKLTRWLRELRSELKTRLAVIDVRRTHYSLAYLYPFAQAGRYVWELFTHEMEVDVFIHVVQKS